MTKYTVFVMLLSITLLAIPAHGNYACQGNITLLGHDWSGNVVVAGPGGVPPVVLCNLSSGSTPNPPNPFTTDACKVAYATLLSAKLSGQSASINFNDSLTCATQPAWSPYVKAYFVSTPLG